MKPGQVMEEDVIRWVQNFACGECRVIKQREKSAERHFARFPLSDQC